MNWLRAERPWHVVPEHKAKRPRTFCAVGLGFRHAIANIKGMSNARKRHCAFALAVTALFAAAGPAAAQYDRDGRYVPSPLGVPADPYARPIPLSSGKPGVQKGTPSLPRAYEPQPPPPPAAVLPRPRLSPGFTNTLPLRFERARCDEVWTKSTGLTPSAFKRRCAALRRN